jgi:hypothetical protein
MNLAFVHNEMDEVAIAMSVAGTKRPKLTELSRMAQEVAEALVGDRPEVQKVRAELIKKIRAVKTASTKPRQSSAAVRKLAGGIKNVQKLIGRGVGGVDARVQLGDFELVNLWGYSTFELRPIKKVLRDAAQNLQRVGLGDLAYGEVILTPRGGSKVVYKTDDDTLEINPDAKLAPRDVLGALGRRFWGTRATDEDVETWGGLSGLERFQAAFGGFLVGTKLDRDTAARLRTTAGRDNKKWAV